jgi:hypothetical protein
MSLHNIRYLDYSRWQYLQEDVLFAGATESAVMGGAVRDTYLGKSVSDIDIFHVGALHLDTYKSLAALKDEDIIEVQMNDSYADVIKCYEIKERRGHKVNLIQVENLKEQMQNFSASISRCGWGDFGLFFSQDFLETLKTGVIRWREPSVNYFNKISTKYPLAEGWKYEGVHLNPKTGKMYDDPTHEVPF